MVAGNDRRRIVIKVGSSTVTDESGRLDRENMKSLVEDMAELCKSGRECVLVTSGAIAAGVEQLGLKERPKQIARLQASAAVGQGALIHEYTGLFRRHNIQAAQILLTQFDMGHRELYLNAKNALAELLKMKTVPIVNENDTTAVEEIKFGDNDILAALVAVLIEADLLVLLSDIDGLYASDPRNDAAARKVDVVDEITPEVVAMAEGIGGRFGSGGMATKINAARLVGAARIGMHIANGREPGAIVKIVNGQAIGTYFKPGKRKVAGKKLWIGFGRTVKGRLIIDKGAAEAIAGQGRSLLPAGVVDLSGDFSIGDTVDVIGPNGDLVARGLTNYSALELRSVRGMRSAQIANEKCGDFCEEVIHRDFMVLF